VSDDHDLRSRLERIASSAGDPPEHGLERITARRHRRLRRRRGAVATAAVLAVAAVVTSLIGRGLAHDRATVTASETDDAAAAAVEVPRSVEVRCEPTGIVVPVASVRPQRDGLHMLVVNNLPGPTRVGVTSTEWSSGPIPVPSGVTEVVQPVPPGALTVSCEFGGDRERRRVDLVDPSGLYQEPELDCDEADRTTLTDLEFTPAEMSLGPAVRRGLAGRMRASDTVDALHGYPSQRITNETADPVVEVARDGEVIAFVHLRGVDGSAAPPWTTLSEVDGCASALAPTTSVPTGPGTTTSAPPPGADPPG
jgi:hypothetical protein